MSYVPYTREVYPPGEAPAPVRSRRALYWTIASVVYLIMGAWFFWWITRPPPIQPPLATIPLGDGTELRLLHIHNGPDYRTYGMETFSDRIRIDETGQYFGGANTRSGRGIWLVYTHFNPRTNRFSPPGIRTFEIIEDGNPFPFTGSTDPSADPSFLHETLLFPVLPRRTATLKVKIQGRATGDVPLETVIPNPAHYLGSPSWKGDALPVRKEVKGVTVEVEKITFGKSRTTVDGRTTVETSAFPSVKVTYPGASADAFATSSEWFDETGNSIERGLLPFSEPVWGLKVLVRETSNFPFPPDRAHSLGKIKIPGPGQVMVLKVPPALAKAGIRDALVVGPGNYRRDGSTISLVNPSGQPGTPLATLKTSSFGNSSNLTTWEIQLYSGRVGGVRNQNAILRVLHGGETLLANSTGSSSNGSSLVETWGHFRALKNKTLSAGDDVEIDMVIPKQFNVEFHLNRPDPPDKPLK